MACDRRQGWSVVGSGLVVRALRWASTRGEGQEQAVDEAGGGPTRRRRARGGRGVSVHVKFTAGEHAAVTARARAAGLTVPSYLALTGLRPEGVPAADARAALVNVMATRRVLAGAAGNLNQLTRKLHGTGHIDAALVDVAREVQRIAGKVEGAVDAVAAVVTGGRRR